MLVYFVINISTTNDSHKLVKFSVPIEALQGLDSYDEIVNKAGWYYINNIDQMSCTGDYRWSVFPIDLINDLHSKFIKDSIDYLNGNSSIKIECEYSDLSADYCNIEKITKEDLVKILKDKGFVFPDSIMEWNGDIDRLGVHIIKFNLGGTFRTLKVWCVKK
jgi:hypothetical protein